MNSFGWSMLIISVVFNVGASLMLKISAQSSESLLPLRLGWGVLDGGLLTLGVAIGCYGVAFIAYLQTLRSIPVSVAYPLITSLTTLAIALIAAYLFGEALGWRAMVGIVLVLAGAALLA